MRVHYRHAQGSLIGQRDAQEDSAAFALTDVTARWEGGTTAGTRVGELVAVLADGMGGHVAGAIASRTACHAFVATYSETPGPHSVKFAASLDAANTSIARQVARQKSLEGMGCTLVAVSFGPTGVRWISVGDSPLFLFRGQSLYQLNEDHSLAPVLDRLAAVGELSAEEAENHPRRHFLRSALTGADIELVDLTDHCLPLEPGDLVVIASDGIETLSHKLLADLLAANRGTTPDGVVAALIDAIVRADHPHQDNATIMVVRPEFVGETVTAGVGVAA